MNYVIYEGPSLIDNQPIVVIASGIDTPSRGELIASNHAVDEIARFVTCDSIGYLSIEGMHAAVGGEGYCDACFSGDYPVPFSRPGGQRRQLALIGL